MAFCCFTENDVPFLRFRRGGGQSNYSFHGPSHEWNFQILSLCFSRQKLFVRGLLGLTQWWEECHQLSSLVEISVATGRRWGQLYWTTVECQPGFWRESKAEMTRSYHFGPSSRWIWSYSADGRWYHSASVWCLYYSPSIRYWLQIEPLGLGVELNDVVLSFGWTSLYLMLAGQHG